MRRAGEGGTARLMGKLKGAMRLQGPIGNFLTMEVYPLALAEISRGATVHCKVNNLLLIVGDTLPYSP